MKIRARAYSGGNWNNGANAGPFYGNLNNAPSDTNTNNGGRLASNGNSAGSVRPHGAPSAPLLGARVLPEQGEHEQARPASKAGKP